MSDRLISKLPVVPDSTWNRMSRMLPGTGPRCYLCNRPILERDRKVWVAVGPEQDRTHFREAGTLEQEYDANADSVQIGSECARRYVPKESIIHESQNLTETSESS
jgi:hypothetical protein